MPTKTKPTPKSDGIETNRIILDTIDKLLGSRVALERAIGRHKLNICGSQIEARMVRARSGEDLSVVKHLQQGIQTLMLKHQPRTIAA